MHAGYIIASGVMLRFRACSVLGFVVETFMGDHVFLQAVRYQWLVSASVAIKKMVRPVLDIIFK